MDGYIVGVGAANVDFHGRSIAPLILRDSNPGQAHTAAGGVTRNVLENLSRLGQHTVLLTAMGEDLLARYIIERCGATGVDLSQALRCPGESSSSYMALLDESGDMYAALSDMRILRHVTPAWLESKKELLLGAQAVVCDPCLPVETLRYLSSGVLAGVPLFADPVSTTYARRLAPLAGGFYCLKPNLMELGAMTGCDVSTDTGMEQAAARLLEQGTGCVVVSLGNRGCYWADAAGRRFFRALPPVARMVDATGAGDAFMGGLVYSACCGMGAEESADIALAAGRIAVSSEGAVSERMSISEIKRVLEVVL